MKKNEKWFVAAKKADFKGIANQFGIDQVTARLIRNRDVIGEKSIQEYLYGTIDSIPQPELLKGCQEAANLLLKKISENKKIRIIGDYDIDGVNATYILYRGIQRCGGLVDYEIPDRMKDGYGLNRALLKLAIEEQIDTVITCDNGIAALEEIQYAKDNGLTIIVTDHHELQYQEDLDSMEANRRYILPDADVVVNPKQPGCEYPYKKLCGAAVAWKVISMLYQLAGIPKHEAEEFITYAGFATVGDVMDLDGENRILVKEALKRLGNTDNLGLRSLIQINGLNPEQISSYHIGFVLGPCINASGRLDTAKRSMKLLLAETKEEADRLATELKSLNDERKDLTNKAVEIACEMIDNNDGDGQLMEHDYSKDSVLVIYLKNCHESIAGIVAGRLRERYYRPVFVITDGENCAKGSGRSIENYSMFDEMMKCSDLFLKFGGHTMAAGFSIETERIPEMRKRLNELSVLTLDDLMEKVAIDIPMPIDYMNEHLIQELELLEPFGKGNEKPLFAERHLMLLGAQILGKNKNVLKLKIMNQAGCMMEALYFDDISDFQDVLIQKYGTVKTKELFWGRGNGMEMDFTYYPSVNEYKGRKTLQIVIKNYR